MKSSARMLVFALLSLVVSLSGAEWLTNSAAAMKKAAAEKKLILTVFSGSDWCGPCINFERTILKSDKFDKFASRNLILLSVDFPQTKPISAELKKQNADLAIKYNVKGFPTIAVMNDKGEVLKRQVGSGPFASPDSFINWLKAVQKSAKK